MSFVYLMKCVEVVGGSHGHDVEGMYLKSMDWRVLPAGDALFTDNPLEAMRFRSQAQAYAYYKMIHPINTTRPDGKPNRPLTAMTMTIEPWEE